VHAHDRSQRAGADHAGPVQGRGHRRAGAPMTDVVFPVVDLRVVAPLLILGGTGLLLVVLDMLPPDDRKVHLALVGVLGVLVSLVVSYRLWGHDARAFRGMVLLDGYALFFNIIIGYATGLVLLLSLDYVR